MTPAPYLIPPIVGPIDAKITLPGSKSIALRQLAMAALAEGKSTITGIPICDDTGAMLDCIAQLGAGVQSDRGAVVIEGPIDFETDVVLDARMSGASTRLLLGLAALRSGKTTIDGHSSLRARTNAPLLKVLARYGCQVKSSNGCLPATIQGPITAPSELHIDGSLSSQYVTALLVSAPLMSSKSTHSDPAHPALTIVIEGDLVSRPYIDITINEMAKRGVHADWINPQTLEVRRGGYQTNGVIVEGDATAATYFAALATLHQGNITLTNLGADTKQGDYGFMHIMESIGAKVSRGSSTTHITGPRTLLPLPPTDMTEMPDAALTLIAMGPLLPTGADISGLSSLHHKECDRLDCPAVEFQGLGISASTEYDSISIKPIHAGHLRSHKLITYHDHRMAMAFSLLGSVSGTLTVDDKTVVDKTYPEYWQDYTTLTQG